MSPEGVLSIVAGTDSWLRASGTMQAKNVMVELMTFLNVSKNVNQNTWGLQCNVSHTVALRKGIPLKHNAPTFYCKRKRERN